MAVVKYRPTKSDIQSVKEKTAQVTRPTQTNNSAVRLSSEEIMNSISPIVYPKNESYENMVAISIQCTNYRLKDNYPLVSTLFTDNNIQSQDDGQSNQLHLTASRTNKSEEFKLCPNANVNKRTSTRQ